MASPHAPSPQATSRRHQGPPLGWLAVISLGLFLAGLYPVTIFGGRPYFPVPSAPLSAIAEFFEVKSFSVLICAMMQFGAAIPLGIYCATIASRFRYLGIRAAGPSIAFMGGLATTGTMLASSSLLWAMSFADTAREPVLIQALYRFNFALGGTGFSVPFGLFLLGISITAGFGRLLPRWAVVAGIMLGAAGELSWLQMMFPKLLFLVPLTRFPGFVWLIVVGFLLPRGVTEMKALQA